MGERPTLTPSMQHCPGLVLKYMQQDEALPTDLSNPPPPPQPMHTRLIPF